MDKNGRNHHNLVIYGKMGRNLKKRPCYVFTFLTPNFVTNFGKIIGAVLEIISDERMNGWTNGQTNGQTNLLL